MKTVAFPTSLKFSESGNFNGILIKFKLPVQELKKFASPSGLLRAKYTKLSSNGNPNVFPLENINHVACDVRHL